MPKLTAFSATKVPSSVVGGRAASAADFGGDGGLLQAGKDVSDFAADLKVREDKRSITEARGSFADMKVLLMEESLERQNNAETGAPGHFDASKTAYDDRMAQFNENLSPVQRQALAGDIANNRVSFMRNELGFQAKESIRADSVNLGKTSLDIQGRIASGKLSVADGAKEYAGNLETSNIPVRLREDMMLTEQPKFRKSLTDGLIENTELGVARLASGELAKVLPPNELSKFKDDLRSRISRNNEIQKNDEIIAFAAAQPEAWAKYSSNTMTLKDLSAFEGRIPQTLYNTMHSRISGNAIPETSLAQKQAAITDTASEFELLDIYNPRKGAKGNASIGGTLEELLNFQKRLDDRHAKGLLTTGQVLGYQKQLSVVTKMLMENRGVGWFGDAVEGPFHTPNRMALGIRSINEAAAKNKWPLSKRASVLGKYNTLLEQEEEKSTKPKDVESEDDYQISKRLYDKAVMQDVRENHPSVPEGINPNAVLTKDGVVKGASATSTDKPDRVIPPKSTIMFDPETSTYILAPLNDKGKPVSEGARALTPEEVVGFGLAPSYEATTEPPSGGHILNDDPSVAVTLPKPVGAVTEEELAEPGLTDVTPGSGNSLDIPPPKGGSPEDPGLTDITPGSGGSLDIPPPKGGSPEEKKTTQTFTGGPGKGVEIPLDLPPSEQAITMVQSTLLANEGTGDKVTGIATGEGGILEARRDEMQKRLGRPLTWEQARNEAVREDSALLHDRLPGFDTLAAPVQAAVLDMAYNVGAHKAANFRKLRIAASAGAADQVLIETLDTAIVKKKTMVGTAARRARMFNAAVTNKNLTITAVEQFKDGTIQYLHNDRVIAFVKRPKHEMSDVGRRLAPDFYP